MRLFPSDTKIDTLFYDDGFIDIISRIFNLIFWAKDISKHGLQLPPLYGREFSDFLMKTCSPPDILIHLARIYVTILLLGEGFAGPKWSVRVSLANLKDDYTAIGKNIRNTVKEFYNNWNYARKN
jgi:hypothetical protein